MINDSTSIMLNVCIRNAGREDLSALEWNGEFQKFRALYLDVYQSSLRGEAVMWIAELKQSGIIGQLFVQLASSRKELADGKQRAYIYGFRVQPAHRGQGIGSELLRVAEEDLRRRGFRWASLNVNRDNQEAMDLYQRRGYTVVAEEAGRWSFIDDQGVRQEVHEPAWRMEKEIAW